VSFSTCPHFTIKAFDAKLDADFYYENNQCLSWFWSCFFCFVLQIGDRGVNTDLILICPCILEGGVCNWSETVRSHHGPRTFHLSEASCDGKALAGMCFQVWDPQQSNILNFWPRPLRLMWRINDVRSLPGLFITHLGSLVPLLNCYSPFSLSHSHTLHNVNMTLYLFVFLLLHLVKRNVRISIQLSGPLVNMHQGVLD